MNGRIRRKSTPEADAAFCSGLMEWSGHPLERGAMPSEGIEGGEWGAYVALLRTARTNMGSPTGRELYGDGGLVVVAGVTTGREGGRAVHRAKGAR